MNPPLTCRRWRRGYINHFAIDFKKMEDLEKIRQHLLSKGASNGRVRDFGMVQIMSFQDPDGMECELTLWKDGKPPSTADSRLAAYGDA